jgi:hypothetical protein
VQKNDALWLPPIFAEPAMFFTLTPHGILPLAVTSSIGLGVVLVTVIVCVDATPGQRRRRD